MDKKRSKYGQKTIYLIQVWTKNGNFRSSFIQVWTKNGTSMDKNKKMS